MVADLTSGGAIARKYIVGPGIDEVLAVKTASSISYLTRDGLNSVSEATDGAGQALESYTYDAFGLPAFFDGSGSSIASSAIGNRYLFTGREWEQESGLYYCRARHYDPGIGRWLQPDPIGEDGGLNLYGYVGNDPTNGIDPLGLDATTILLPFGNSFSFHVPGTPDFPGEDVHEAQHREDWASGHSYSGWKLEQRAFAAQAKYLRKRIKKMKKKECQTDADKKKLADFEDALRTAEAIANSDQAAKDYWNAGKRWWQKKAM